MRLPVPSFAGLRARLLLLALVAILPTVAFMLADGLHQRRRAAEDARVEALRLTRVASANLEREIDGTRQILGVLAELPPVRSRDEAGASRILADLRERNPTYANLGVADRTGDIWASALPHPGKVNASDREWFRGTLRSGDFAAGEYQLGRITHRATLNFGHPVQDGDGRITGVVFAALDLEAISELAEVAALPAGAVVTIVDRKGTVLVRHPRGENRVGRLLPEAPVVDAVLKRREGTLLAAGPDGVERIYAFAPLAAARTDGGFVAVGFSAEQAFAEANREITRHLAALGIVALLSLLGVWFGGDLFIVRKVRALTRATARLGSGDLSARTGVARGRGELDRLARAFDDMASALEGREREAERTAAALQESQARFQAFMDNSPAVAFIKDADGRYVYFNRPFERCFQVTPADLYGRTDAAWFPKEVAERLQENDRAVLRANEPCEVSEQVPTPDGTPHEWLVFKFPIEDTSGRRLLGGVAVDITQRQRLEEQFRRAQKMEAVGRLAGGVAHDFNNVLTAILGFSELALVSLGPRERARESIEEIRKAGLRAATLTRQLLAFSRREVSEPRDLDLNAVLADMQKMLERLIGEGIRLITAPGEALGAVRADPGQIEQVIANLVVNAADAMPRGGNLVLETANVTLDVPGAALHDGLPPGEYVLLSVTDTGIGMDADTRARIFEPFFTTKEPGKGTGLGLSTVYGIVKQRGGDIQVYSEPGRGTTFKICFPRSGTAAARRATGAATEAPSGGSLPRGTETVLLVEDDAPVRAVGIEALRSAGYDVVEARNGIEALGIFEQMAGRIRLVITDVVMPEMGGPELIRNLEARGRIFRTLFVSGYADRAMNGHGVLGPGVAFLQKPYTPAVLARKVREVLDEIRDRAA